MTSISARKSPNPLSRREQKKQQRRRSLDEWLERFLADTRSHFQDPIDCVDSQLHPADKEIVAFIVAGLSYGRVEQIRKSSFALLQRLEKLGIDGARGEGLARYLREQPENISSPALQKCLVGWKHRLNTSSDIHELLLAVSKILKQEGSLARLFQRLQAAHADPKARVQEFAASLFPEVRAKRSRDTRKRWSGTGPHWFAPQPADGGSCKRLLMYLRWMIRQDRFDLGCWQEPELLDPRLERPRKEDLFVPVDTHILKWAQTERIISTRNATWKTVEGVSHFFWDINPQDPLKYDFMICHEGMKVFRAL